MVSYVCVDFRCQDLCHREVFGAVGEGRVGVGVGLRVGVGGMGRVGMGLGWVGVAGQFNEPIQGLHIRYTKQTPCIRPSSSSTTWVRAYRGRSCKHVNIICRGQTGH